MRSVTFTKVQGNSDCSDLSLWAKTGEMKCSVCHTSMELQLLSNTDSVHKAHPGIACTGDQHDQPCSLASHLEPGCWRSGRRGATLRCGVFLGQTLSFTNLQRMQNRGLQRPPKASEHCAPWLESRQSGKAKGTWSCCQPADPRGDRQQGWILFSHIPLEQLLGVCGGGSGVLHI